MRFTHAISSADTRLTFDGKPSEAIRTLLKANGFRWSPPGGFWWRRGCKGAADFICALDKRLNPGRPDGACWVCQSPEGRFRREGAASPVRCDECQTSYRASALLTERAERRQTEGDRFDMAYEDDCASRCGM